MGFEQHNRGNCKLFAELSLEPAIDAEGVRCDDLYFRSFVKLGLLGAFVFQRNPIFFLVETDTINDRK